MPNSTATFSTARASTYLQQLCKHFGHKVPVEFTPQEGQIILPFGTCALKAAGDKLTLDVTGGADTIERLQRVIGDHLARFAFRESPDLKWLPSAS